MPRRFLVYLGCLGFILISCLAPILPACAASSGPALYQMDDLEVLAQDHAWEEYLKHALDIRPSERQGRWKELTSKVAARMVQELQQAADFSDAAWAKVQQAANLQVLQDDDIFQLQRALWGQAYFAYHWPRGEKGHDFLAHQLAEFWQGTPSTPQTLEAAAKLGELLQTTSSGPAASSSVDAWPLWARIVQSDLAHLYCTRPSTQRALVARLAEATTELEAWHLARPSCWQAAVNVLKQQLASHKYAFYILDKLDLLNRPERSTYLVNYLLQDSPNGPTYDQAWGAVQELGKDYALRQQVLAQIKAQNILPDQIFKQANPRRTQAVLRHLQANFPEYITYYLTTCLAYLQGTRAFAQGNPTMYCRDFYEQAKSDHLINEGLQSSFEGLTLKF